MYEPNKEELREALQDLIDSGEAIQCGGKTALLARKMSLTNYVPIVVPGVETRSRKSGGGSRPQRAVFGGRR